MRLLTVFLLMSIPTVLQAAEESLIFKKEVASSFSFIPYGLVFIILIITVFILAKNFKKHIPSQSRCTIIERINIHYKTKIYIIDYAGHKFMIADNQNAIAIQPMQENC